MRIDILYANTKWRSLLLAVGPLVGIECYADTVLAGRGAGRRLREVLDTLKTAYRIDIAYPLKLVEGKLVDKNRIISYLSGLEDNLEKNLEPFGLTYKKRHNSYIIIWKEESKKTSSAGDSPLSGNIQFPMPDDAPRHLQDGARHHWGTVPPLTRCSPGVNVAVKGTMQGVVTDAEGKYSVSMADDSPVLVFSSIGYVTREVIFAK